MKKKLFQVLFDNFPSKMLSECVVTSPASPHAVRWGRMTQGVGGGLVEDHFFSSNFSENGCYTLWAVNLCIPVGLPGVFLACSGLHLLLNQSEKKPQTYKLFNMRHTVNNFPMRLFFTFGDNKKQ